ncbi:ACN9-domain-containing protein [Rhodotorula sp. JG-1b]|nr:ACN9-domain-containing protein [Rhodotorula sp. JG-1b]
MASPALAASLAQLTGLDVATAQEQLLPHLDSLQNSNEVRNHLDSLLAPGPAAQQFVALYTAYRFPPAPAAPSKAGGTSTWARRNAAAASTSVSMSSSAASSRAASPAHGRLSREKDLDRALKTAPKGGKVYIKEREDQLDQQWGGAAARTAASRSSSGQRPSAPPVPVVPAPFHVAAGSAGPSRAAASAQPQNKGKAKATPGAAASEAETELSEEGAVELLRIERALRGFEPRKESQRRSCFCQARQHPLASYAPLCPRCSLVLCVINLPSAPCPSCSHTPLLSSAAVATHIASLQSAREDLLAREKRRVQLAKEQEERERAAIRFPDLAAAEARGPVPSGVRSYAGHAGGGSTMSERIDRATGAGRVLRLDGKTGRVKVQTKVVKPSTASSSNGRGKATVVEETTAVLDADDDDGLVPWIDVNDDGVRGQLSLRSVDGETIAQRRRPVGRLFANVTLPDDEWPVWVPAASDESRLDDDDGDDLANETGGEAGDCIRSCICIERSRTSSSGNFGVMAFRATFRRCAADIQNLSPSATSELAKELLPPLQLYRRLLRVHRKVLPVEMRLMGDEYVKAEFRRTRSTDNPLHIVGFLSEWKKYLDHHEALLEEPSASAESEEAAEAAANASETDRKRRAIGQRMDPSVLEALSADQIGQLYELFQASQDVWLTPEELEAKLKAEGRTEEGIPAGQVLPDLGKANRIGGDGEGR